MKKIFSYTAIAGIALFAACNNNTSETTETSTDTTITPSGDTAVTTTTTTVETTNKDADFVADVIKANAMELKMLAAGKTMGTDKQLRDNAKKMESDHKKLATTMMNYASDNGIAIDTSGTDHDMADDKKGKEWDEDWAEKMVDEHQKTIDKFEDAKDDVRDSTLKNIITGTLPTLRAHLSMSKALKEKLDKK